MRKNILIAMSILVGCSLLFMIFSRKVDKVSLENVSKIHVMMKVENGILKKEFESHLDEMNKMLGELKIKKVDMDTRLGWELGIIGYNAGNEEEVRIFFDGENMTFNDEQYVCERKQIEELMNYFGKEL